MPQQFPIYIGNIKQITGTFLPGCGVSDLGTTYGTSPCLPQSADDCVRRESESPRGEDESTNTTQTAEAEERTGWLTTVNFLRYSRGSLSIVTGSASGTGVTGNVGHPKEGGKCLYATASRASGDPLGSQTQTQALWDWRRGRVTWFCELSRCWSPLY